MMRNATASLVLILLAFSGTGRSAVAADPPAAGPAVVLLIRHAEKPDDHNDPNLTPRGFERANALATVLPAHFPRPDFLFATKRSAHSDRPLETITPLAHALKLPVDTTFKDAEYGSLARRVLTDPKYAGKTVLIAWHHGALPALAHALGAKAAPDRWASDTTYDRVWEITWHEGVPTFKDLPQRALAGDSDK